MADCSRLKDEKVFICIGALNKKISIQERGITFNSSVDNGEGFVTVANPWARVSTKTKEVFFDETNTDALITHTFEIRFNPSYNFTSENFILYKGERYKILKTENIGEDDLFFRMDCNVLGNSDKEVNRA